MYFNNARVFRHWRLERSVVQQCDGQGTRIAVSHKRVIRPSIGRESAELFRRSYRLASRTNCAAFSPIMMAGAFVLPDGIMGMIDASATRSPSTP